MDKKEIKEAYEKLRIAIHRKKTQEKYGYIRMLQDIGVYLNIIS